MQNMRTNGSAADPGKKGKWIILAALLGGVVISAAILFTLIGHSASDEGVIPLVPSDPTQASTQTNPASEDTRQPSDPQETKPATAATETTPTESVFVAHPGFQVSDDEKVWSTETNVDIFRLSYVNGEGVVTVNSDNGDKLIAPGTENAYTFRLKNTGNCAMDYTMTMEAYFSSAEWTIPVEVRMKSYNGSWLIGGDDSWEDVLELNGIADSTTLGVNRYAYYTLEWRWPFETGNDEWDTMLGNLSVSEDVSLTIVIRTVASQNPDPNAGSNNGLAQTGDSFRLLPYLVLLTVSGAAVALLVVFGKCGKKADDESARNGQC